MTPTPVIEINQLDTRFGEKWVHKGLDLTINRGEIVAIVGGSGSGKTTLLREILGLTRPAGGTIKIFGKSLTDASVSDMLSIQRRWGVLFQQNALFGSLTVLENVCFPLRERTEIDEETARELAAIKIQLAGLPADAMNLYPSELSGGMQKRAGIARAIVMDPELIFLDEPTAGLDPNTAAAFDELILNLQRTMGLTIVIVTHDLDTLWHITNRVAFLGDKRVLCVDSMQALVKNDNPQIQAFFHGTRGRVAEAGYEREQDGHQA